MLYCGSDDGAHWNTVAVSLVASCQLHGIEPWAYLRDVLTLLPAWPVNRVTSETWTYGGKTYTTTYKYDQYGCPYSVQYPTGLALTNTCDSANRIKTMSIGSTTIVKDVTYHPSGQVAKMTYGDTKCNRPRTDV